MRYELSYLNPKGDLPKILKPGNPEEARHVASALPKGADIVLMRLDDDGKATACFIWDCRGKFVVIWIADEGIPL